MWVIKILSQLVGMFLRNYPLNLNSEFAKLTFPPKLYNKDRQINIPNNNIQGFNPKS